MNKPTAKRSDFGQRVRLAREAIGLTQRDVAAQLQISQPSYALWEKNHVALRPDQLLRLAEILGLRVEQLLDPPKASNRRGGPAGKARRLFEAVSELPRSRQQKILEVLEALVAQQSNGKTA